MTEQKITEPQQQQEATVHKRRPRYSGTYPKSYNEKYKELQPDKYSATVARVISKGSTPAGMHIPIMVQEILNFLQIRPGQIGFDATLGYGGHTLAMLKALGKQGHIYATDVDPIESKNTRIRLEKLGYGANMLTVVLSNFANVDIIAMEAGKFDFILADLGVSSMQIDNPDRGFSYKKDGPLDLRMNPDKGISAATRLQRITQAELEGMLLENADEPYAKEIAKAIIDASRCGKLLDTTFKLHETIEGALKKVPAQERKEAVKKACTRTFQALRIDVNHEYEVLYEFLEKLPSVLNPGGRVAILTFHSGEDRLVKKAFKNFYQQGLYSEIAKDVIRPSAEECARNSRARSTKLRWAIRNSD